MWQDQGVFWLLFGLSEGSFEAGKALGEGGHDAAPAALRLPGNISPPGSVVA